jgi:hypothetical protein
MRRGPHVLLVVGVRGLFPTPGNPPETYSRSCRTSPASPAEPGGLPTGLANQRISEIACPGKLALISYDVSRRSRGSNGIQSGPEIARNYSGALQMAAPIVRPGVVAPDFSPAWATLWSLAEYSDSRWCIGGLRPPDFRRA